MPAHIRRCVECPKCFTRYLIGFSPYRNGAYLVPIAHGSYEGYTLYCSCRGPATSSQWKGNEMKFYSVVKAAHERGYGTCEEIVALGEKQKPSPAAIGEELHSNKRRGRKIS